jgi:outer membrane protein OmpA-like peptidoglycan-associated protein
LLVPSWPESIPADYRDAVHNGLRVSLTIHFPPDTTEVDAAASRELDVLAYYLRLLKVNAEKLRHIGFSEDTGDPRENARISQQLADIVADELRHRKVYAGEVLAFGAALPLASDAIPSGRRRNRRVETWILP